MCGWRSGGEPLGQRFRVRSFHVTNEIRAVAKKEFVFNVSGSKD